MDKIEALGSSLAQISLYDIKSYYNQAKAVVLNYTEMEAKVREATNDDAWGASSTLMQEISQGQQFNEIMPTIYKRFTEKEAREWRQIYKALQLLEYLIKHGSERVIDDARSHVSMIKVLRSFHYVDEKGKDQGINVRNRAKEIVELLSDLDRVRQERRKAKASRNKYTGVGNDGPSFTSASGSRYGGFGSDTGGFSGFSGGGGHDECSGGGSGNSRDQYGGGSSSFKQSDDFEEYDAGEWEDRPASSATHNVSSQPTRARGSVGSIRVSNSTAAKKSAEKPAAPTAKAKEVDLFSFDDDDNVVSPTSVSSNAPAPVPATNSLASLDDDFDDFQSAPPMGGLTSPTVQNTSSQSAAKAKPNVFALLNAPPTQAAQPTTQPTMGNFSALSSLSNQSMVSPPAGQTMPNASMMQPMMGSGMSGNFGSSMASNNWAGNVNQPMSNFGTPMNTSMSAQPAASATSKSASNSANFDDLFSFAGLTSGTSTQSAASKPAAKVSMATMAREQSSASIWGGNTMNAKPAGAVMGTPLAHSSNNQSHNITNSMSNNDDLLL
ncbi:hypothetical protein CROQUDRAFT_48796 [Cronartium quercuum f. sp. fusiforme G11]|uniref:ENTH domain-containing protein n=1 Tax=Cronartium quercuum f. sp. fusiforme G11 TaxID=708437 RepID=A0A9P6NGZ2_9BASI|nr:hypothetical protein CROQUDRAFT_48796 [Cronartium quercuum f. sp. fusiforme G11]